jgi:hypothetical protein
MSRERSKSFANSSQSRFSKKFRKASHTTRRRLSPIKEVKYEDRSASKSSSKSSSNKSSPKELIMVSRQKKSTYLLNNLPEMNKHSNVSSNSNVSSKKSSKKGRKTNSLIKSIKNIFSF